MEKGKIEKFKGREMDLWKQIEKLKKASMKESGKPGKKKTYQGKEKLENRKSKLETKKSERTKQQEVDNSQSKQTGQAISTSQSRSNNRDREKLEMRKTKEYEERQIIMPKKRITYHDVESSENSETESERTYSNIQYRNKGSKKVKGLNKKLKESPNPLTTNEQSNDSCEVDDHKDNGKTHRKELELDIDLGLTGCVEFSSGNEDNAEEWTGGRKDSVQRKDSEKDSEENSILGENNNKNKEGEENRVMENVIDRIAEEDMDLDSEEEEVGDGVENSLQASHTETYPQESNLYTLEFSALPEPEPVHSVQCPGCGLDLLANKDTPVTPKDVIMSINSPSDLIGKVCAAAEQETDPTLEEVHSILRVQQDEPMLATMNVCHRFVTRKKGTFIDYGNGRNQYVVPMKYRASVISWAHCDPRHREEHRTCERTLDRLNTAFFWPCMRDDVASFVKACKGCRVFGDDTGDPNRVGFGKSVRSTTKLETVVVMGHSYVSELKNYIWETKSQTTSLTLENIAVILRVQEQVGRILLMGIPNGTIKDLHTGTALKRHKPSVILVDCGFNDLAKGADPKHVAEDIVHASRVLALNCHCYVVLFSALIESTGGSLELQAIMNKTIEAYNEHLKYLTKLEPYIDYFNMQGFWRKEQSGNSDVTLYKGSDPTSAIWRRNYIYGLRVAIMKSYNKLCGESDF